MHVYDQSLGKTLSDVNFFYGKKNESVYSLVLLELQRLQFILQDLHRLQFILWDLQHLHVILQELQHLKAILRELQEMPNVLKLKALAWKDIGTQGNSGYVYASGTTHS
ncbi:hypothetical protein Tco_0555757 [Tanacetum coccineum]